MTLTVVIPTKNRSKDLERCLLSLRNQTWKNFEVLVIDNGSSDDTQELVRQHGFRLLVDTTPNLSRLFNLGWRLSRTDIIAYLNDDVEVVGDWAYTVVDFLHKNKTVAAIGGPTIAMRRQRLFQTYLISQNSFLLKFAFGLYDKIITRGRFFAIGDFDEWGNSTIGGSLLESTKISKPLEVRGLSITNMAIRRNVLQALGGFDESFRYIHCDGDLFLRMRKRGYKMMFVPTMIAYHYLNPIGNTRSAYYWGRDFMVLWLKHVRSKEAALRATLHALFILMYVMALGQWGNKSISFLSYVTGLFEGLRYYISYHHRILW